MEMQEKVLKRVHGIRDHELVVFKDKDYQRNIWFKCEGPEVSSFIDDVDYFIGKCQKLFKMPNYYEELGTSTGDKLKHLYSIVCRFLDEVELTIDFTTSDFEEQQLLSDPRWNEIVEASKDVYQALSEYIGNDIIKIPEKKSF